MRTFSPSQFTAIFCVAFWSAHTHAFIHVHPLQSLAPRTTSMSPSILSMDTLNSHELNIEALVDEAAAAAGELSESEAAQGLLDNGVSQLIDEEDDMQTEMDRKHMKLAIQMATSRYATFFLLVTLCGLTVMSILGRAEPTKTHPTNTVNHLVLLALVPYYCCCYGSSFHSRSTSLPHLVLVPLRSRSQSEVL